MCIDLIREFLEFYRMDYTLSTFLPECSLSQEPKTRTEIEKKVGLPASNTSMPLLMHLINAVKNGVANVPMQNNLVSPPASDKKQEKPKTDELLWESKNMDIKHQLDDNSSKKSSLVGDSPGQENKKLSSLNDLPPLTQKKGGLEPLNFNPKEDESITKEKKNLAEVDKKLKEFEMKDSMKVEMSKSSPDKKAQKFGGKQTKPKAAGFDDYDDDFEDDIAEDLPVEDFDANDHRDNHEFGESGVSASQSMGIDPSVNSLDIEEYDHVEQAIINSPYKM